MSGLNYLPILPKSQDFSPTLSSDSNSFTQDQSNNAFTSLQSFSPNITLFPQQLESSGYIILSAVALIFSLFFLVLGFQIHKLVQSLKNNMSLYRDIICSNYIQQQSVEYRLLLNELNSSISPIEKNNARTSLYNFMNKICREICEGRDTYLAKQLLVAFMSKIQARYIKIEQFPDGLLYFKVLGKFLLTHKEKNTEDVYKTVQSFVKKEVKEYLQLVYQSDKAQQKQDSLSQNTEKPKKNGWFNKK